MAVGPVREGEGDAVEPHAEVRLWPLTSHTTHVAHQHYNYSDETSTQAVIRRCIVFLDVWLLRVYLCGLRGRNFLVLSRAPETAKTHKQQSRRTNSQR